MRHLQSKETVITFSQFVYLALILVYFERIPEQTILINLC